MTIPSTATRLALGAALLVGASTFVRAQDSGALIDALVKKGILSDQEAEDIRADLTRDFGQNTPAGKLDISSNVTRLRLSGDARVRYQYDNEVTNPVGAPNERERNRYRYRLRFGAMADLGPKWTAAFRMETASSATSTNADLGSGTDNFSKDTDFVYFGQVYVNYRDTDFLGADNVDFRAGKLPHKFFNPGVNGFWIDTDINFEGLAEEAVYTNVFGTDGTLSLRAGQFILNNNAANAGSGPVAGGSTVDPSLLHIVQADYTTKSVTVAPAFVVFGAPAQHDRANNTAALQARDTDNYTDLATVLVPAEFRTTLGSKPVAFYATYGHNFSGDDRAYRLAGAVTPAAKRLVDAKSDLFNLGVRYGELKNAGDYQLVGEYRSVGNGSYSSLLLDSDFNGGLLNGEGYILSGSYNWTPAITSTLSYFNSKDVEDNRATGASRGNGFRRADVVQVDLSAKF